MTQIIRAEIHEFTFEAKNIGIEQASAGISNLVHQAGNTFTAKRYAVQLLCDDGLKGEYVTHWGGSPAALAQTLMLAPFLVGRNPEQREQIYDDLKRELRAFDHMGHGALDIALWDLLGKKYNTSVAALLGAYRTRLPTYASTYHAQPSGGGLDSPKAFADFAQHCRELGFTALKIHGWNDGNVAREIENLRGVRARIGDAMDLMLDPACQLRTWNDALAVGRVCDEVGCLWYEDPYRDAAVSAFGHQRLREKLSTPLLVSEHVRGLEQKASFIINGGCDMIHADPEYDMGITGAVKIAHLCEALGLDLQIHACGPAHRAVIAATRNTRFYEMALMGPNMPNVVPPVYTCGYSDQPEDLGADGCVPVPDGPGLGVTYDWDYIAAHRTAHHVFGGDG